jgi:hypothetical protein
MDIDPPKLGTLKINGDLMFDDSRDLNILRAKNIWIVKGNLTAGSSRTPYKNKIRIELHSSQYDGDLLIDQYV